VEDNWGMNGIRKCSPSSGAEEGDKFLKWKLYHLYEGKFSPTFRQTWECRVLPGSVASE
jgi:hypothetical protein